MQDRPEATLKSLYEVDFHRWCLEQAVLIRARRYADLDLDNVAEEIESLGHGNKQLVPDLLEGLIAHLLMWTYQSGARLPVWQEGIREARGKIRDLVAGSPSLAEFPASMALDCYRAGRLVAATETGIDFTLFPDQCPFTAGQILDPDVLPKEPGLYDQS